MSKVKSHSIQVQKDAFDEWFRRSLKSMVWGCLRQKYAKVTFTPYSLWFPTSMLKFRPQLQEAGYEGVFQQKKRDRQKTIFATLNCETCQTWWHFWSLVQDPIFHRGKYTAEGYPSNPSFHQSDAGGLRLRDFLQDHQIPSCWEACAKTYWALNCHETPLLSKHHRQIMANNFLNRFVRWSTTTGKLLPKFEVPVWSSRTIDVPFLGFEL